MKSIGLVSVQVVLRVVKIDVDGIRLLVARDFGLVPLASAISCRSEKMDSLVDPRLMSTGSRGFWARGALIKYTS